MMSAAALNFGDMNGDSSSGFSGTLNLADKIQSRHDIIDIGKKVGDQHHKRTPPQLHGAIVKLFRNRSFRTRLGDAQHAVDFKNDIHHSI